MMAPRSRLTAVTVLPPAHPKVAAAVKPEQWDVFLFLFWATVHPAPLKVEEEATVHPAPPRLVVLPVNHVIHMAVHQSGKLKCFHSAFGVTTAPVCNADSGAACGPRDLHGSPQERYFFFPSSCNEGSALTVLPPAHQTMLAAGMPEQHKG